MAAPCALAMSKLSYPETEESSFKSDETINVSCGCVNVAVSPLYSLKFGILPMFLNATHLLNLPRDEQNILEAASSGASASVGLVANIAANLIAFLAILGFINQALSWLGGMVGYPALTFQV